MSGIELEIPADVAYVGLARLVVTTAARQAGMEDGRVEDLRIAVSEAATNAILARQHVDQAGPVVLTFGRRDASFEVTVRDTAPPDGGAAGPGGAADDWSVAGELGVTVIRGLADAVDLIRDSASRVHMRFGISLSGDSGQDGDPSDKR